MNTINEISLHVYILSVIYKTMKQHTEDIMTALLEALSATGSYPFETTTLSHSVPVTVY